MESSSFNHSAAAASHDNATTHPSDTHSTGYHWPGVEAIMEAYQRHHKGTCQGIDIIMLVRFNWGILFFNLSFLYLFACCRKKSGTQSVKRSMSTPSSTKR